MREEVRKKNDARGEDSLQSPTRWSCMALRFPEMILSYVADNLASSIKD
jgi:hypothetical protein